MTKKKKDVTFTVETSCERCGSKLKNMKWLSEADLQYTSTYGFCFKMSPSSLGLNWITDSTDTKVSFVCNGCQKEYEELVSKLSRKRHSEIDDFFKG